MRTILINHRPLHGLDCNNFLSNDRLEERLNQTTVTPQQVDEAMIAFITLGMVDLLARMLPNYRPVEVPVDPVAKVESRMMIELCFPEPFHRPASP